jgi:hypothetical protein
MTIDLLSGNVTKVKVQDKEFHVVKHIHSSLILFGRGTHIFPVRSKDKKFHILKNAWFLSTIEIPKSLSSQKSTTFSKRIPVRMLRHTN